MLPDNSLSHEFEKWCGRHYNLMRKQNKEKSYSEVETQNAYVAFKGGYNAALNSRVDAKPPLMVNADGTITPLRCPKCVDVEALRSFAESMMTLPETAQYAHVHAIKLGAASALGLPYSIPEADALMECGLSVCSTTILDELRTDNDKLREANRVLATALEQILCDGNFIIDYEQGTDAPIFETEAFKLARGGCFSGGAGIQGIKALALTSGEV